MGNCCSYLNCCEGNVQVTDRKEKTLKKPRTLSIMRKESSENLQYFQKRTPSVILDSEDYSENAKKSLTININYCKCGGRLHFSQSLAILPWIHDQKCETCKRISFSSFFICDKCTCLMCSFCAKVFGYKFSVVYCLNNHRLTLEPNRVAELFEQGSQKSFTCEDCKQQKIEPSWTCKSCNFDLCLQCGRLSGLDMAKIELQCFQNHDLKFKVLESAESKTLQCSECFKSGCRERLLCEECEFSYCFLCAVFKLSIIFDMIRCGKRHQMSVVHLKQMKKLQTWITCLNCSLATLKLAYHCSECAIALCLNCHSQLVHLKLKNSSKRCQCSRRLEVVLNPSQETICKICSEPIDSSFFECFSCRSSTCLTCVELI